MDTHEAIDNRLSYRGSYTDQKVSRTDLKRIVKSGIVAPSGKNRQTTSFIVVDDANLLKSLAELVGHQPNLESAQAAIVVLMERDTNSDPGYYFGFQDFAAAVENMLLSITALGLATVWIEGQLFQGSGARIGELLGVPDSLEVRVLLPIGYPAEGGKQREKKPFAERAWFNGYQNEE